MRRSVVLDNLSKIIPPIDPDQRMALLHAPFKGTTLFGGELAKVYRANKEWASSVTVYPAAIPQSYASNPYIGRGRSFRKGGFSYRRSGEYRDWSRSAPVSTVTRPSRSGEGRSTMTVTVPQEPNKRSVQTHEDAPRSKRSRKLGKHKSNRKEWGHAPTTINSSRRTTVPVCGGVETYNERSFCVKYRSQGVQTSFYETTPSAADSLGDTNPQGDTEDPGNARANLPNASKERNLRNISRHSRVLFERINGTQGIWSVASSYGFKTTEPPHWRSSLSHAHYKLSAEYRRKRRLRVQDRSAECVLSCTYTSKQQEVPSFCLRK